MESLIKSQPNDRVVPSIRLMLTVRMCDTLHRGVWQSLKWQRVGSWRGAHVGGCPEGWPLPLARFGGAPPYRWHWP